jgi:MFS family permease
MKILSEDVKIGMAILTFLPLGLGSIIGPLIMGLIQDRYGHKASILYIIFNIILAGSILIYMNE